jgi:Family of unknown function (DUF6328)
VKDDSMTPVGRSTVKDDLGRDESEGERLDRNLAELLQELRVAGLGVQVLFGFLLALPFSNRFSQVSSGERVLYLTDLLLAALATVLLLAPVAYHRLVFRRHEKRQLLRFANVTAVSGLVAVALAVSAAVLLDVSFVEGGSLVAAVGVSMFVLFGGLWFALPLWRRGGFSGEPSRDSQDEPDWRPRAPKAGTREALPHAVAPGGSRSKDAEPG